MVAVEDKERNRGAYLQSFTGHGEILKEKTEIIKNPTIETQTFLNPLFPRDPCFFVRKYGGGRCLFKGTHAAANAKEARFGNHCKEEE